jgi:hypothetical protein
MRNAMVLFAGLFIFGCGRSASSLPVESVELGATGLDVRITSQGKGSYLYGMSNPSQKRTTFDIGSTGFKRLISSVAPFRIHAGPIKQTVERFYNNACSEGVPFVTDQGLISVRWTGKGFDQIYIADLGCDYDRNAARNKKLFAILNSLPVPKPMPWP